MSVCENCGKENQAHYKYCLGCGAELPDDPRPVPAVSRTVAAEPADPGLMDALATALDGGGTRPSWKPNGEPAEPSAPVGGDASGTAPAVLDRGVGPGAPRGRTRPCPTCGNQVPVDFAFCGQCGTRLGEQPAKSVPRTMFLGQQAPAASTSPRGRLVLVRPDGSEGGSHPLEEGENPIGRGHGPLFDADGYLSPRHAELVLNAAGLAVRDTGSLNGVFVKITDEEELYDGDIFRIGQELLRFDAIRPPEPLDDGTEVLGSPNPGYWGRLALIVSQDQDGSAFPLFGDSIVLGREHGDILFPEDGYVSGTHARVSTREDRFFLADLNSSNGTFLRIRGERIIPSGSFVLMGQQLFRVVFT